MRYRRTYVLNKTSTERGLYQICFFAIFVWTFTWNDRNRAIKKDIGQYVYCEVYTMRLSDPTNNKKKSFQCTDLIWCSLKLRNPNIISVVDEFPHGILNVKAFSGEFVSKRSGSFGKNVTDPKPWWMISILFLNNYNIVIFSDGDPFS